MMKKTLLALAAASLLAAPAQAQLDVGGAISGAIQGATGGNQAGAAAGAQLGAQGSANNAGVLPGGAINSGAQINAGANTSNNQSWLGRVGNELRNAFRPDNNGNLQLQGDVNSSLQQYGFRPGDQLIGSNGQPLTQAQFDQYLQQNQGQVRVLRNGQTVVLNGNVGYQQNQGNRQGGYSSGGQQYYPGGQPSYSSGQFAGQSVSGRPRLGITMDPYSQGVVVTGVTVGSPASQAGIRPGDQILAVNGQSVSNPQDMIQLVNNTQSDQNLDIQYVRQGRELQSQVMLASATSYQSGGAYQAGYAQPMDGHSHVTGASGQFSGAANGNIQQRLSNLERMVQELRNEIRQQRGGQSSQEQDSSDQSTNPTDDNSNSNDSDRSTRSGNTPPDAPTAPSN